MYSEFEQACVRTVSRGGRGGRLKVDSELVSGGVQGWMPFASSVGPTECPTVSPTFAASGLFMQRCPSLHRYVVAFLVKAAHIQSSRWKFARCY